LSNKEYTEDQLETFVDRLILDLVIPNVVGLKGDLGSGKTTLAKKIIAAYGIEESVTSPTFNIVKEYKVENFHVFHVDLYRLSSVNEFYDLDLPLFQENTLFLIEWADLIPSEVSNEWTVITIEVVDDLTRRIRI
jgi:tRNA threonylcarbamoyladenosine biosynthesis protein TsaE|tara:strand:+ start:23 stop:427 length:405 start_codon:yes stop_codon:yes gene_type:complete